MKIRIIHRQKLIRNYITFGWMKYNKCCLKTVDLIQIIVSANIYYRNCAEFQTKNSLHLIRKWTVRSHFLQIYRIHVSKNYISIAFDNELFKVHTRNTFFNSHTGCRISFQYILPHKKLTHLTFYKNYPNFFLITLLWYKDRIQSDKICVGSNSLTVFHSISLPEYII